MHVLLLKFLTSDEDYALDFNPRSRDWGPEHSANQNRIDPPGEWNTDKWYYVAGVYLGAELDENGDVAKLGSISLFMYDGTTVFSDSLPWEYPRFVQRFPPLTFDRVRLHGLYAAPPQRGVALDDVTFFDQAFDPQSFLVSVLGIPEPTSLAMLALGGLLLARRRRGA